jgi:oxygen-independent coproporphyrinogen III oxidase
MKNGIYIHIPFCLSRCHYCHFPTQLWREDLAEKYAHAVAQEIFGFVKTNASENRVDSIYFGGGTPSLLSSRQINEILNVCKNSFTIAVDCEISLEANPDTITESKASAWQEIGINRISLGAQSFSDQELAAVGRIHSAAQIEVSFRLLRQCGFKNINLDLMLGLPRQTERQWRLNLETVESLSPEHLSIYMLDFEGAEPLYQSVKKGTAGVPDEDSVADWYLISLDRMSKASYDQYEISNFAMPGFQCRHNLKYWLRFPVLGFGLGSHSHDGEYRYANHADLNTYFKSLEEGISPIEWRRRIGETEALQETLFLGLRLCNGIDWDQLECTFPPSKTEGYKKALQELQSQGLVEWQGVNVHLTRSGMLLSNELFQRFV